MKIVNIQEAKTHLSRLLAEVAAGEEIVIAKAGKPVARIVPVAGQRPERVLGIDKGRVVINDDFDAPLPDEMVAGFERRGSCSTRSADSGCHHDVGRAVLLVHGRNHWPMNRA